MRIGEHHRRDFAFYLGMARRVRGFDPGGGIFNGGCGVFRGGPSALECYVRFDSHGQVATMCRQPRLLHEVMRGKRLANWHIKQWAESVRDIPPSEIRADYEERRIGVPPWVWKSLDRAVGKGQ